MLEINQDGYVFVSARCVSGALPTRRWISFAWDICELSQDTIYFSAMLGCCLCCEWYIIPNTSFCKLMTCSGYVYFNLSTYMVLVNIVIL